MTSKRLSELEGGCVPLWLSVRPNLNRTIDAVELIVTED
jgi:hypothetical protein